MFTKDFPHSVKLRIALEQFLFKESICCMFTKCGRGQMPDRAASLAQLE